MTEVAVRDPERRALRLAVSEVFGPTWQGEGPSSGVRAGFVRLAGCNLDCGAGHGATWACDTPYSWDWRGKLGVRYERDQEVTHPTVAEVLRQVLAMDVPLVVVSGGEPLLQQQRGLDELAILLANGYRMRLEVETNGTVAPARAPVLRGVAWWNVSPKLANSGVALDRRYHPEVLAELAGTGRACFKFVATHEADVAEAAAMVAAVGLDPRTVWIMPAGTTGREIARAARYLAPAVEAHGFNLSLRQHVAVWGNERGR